jgi:SAM-dependent methyltransferase
VPEPRYRLVLSISTLEHVGWDEEPREPEKAAAAVRHLARCLAPGGRLLFTVPLGWNPVFDAALASGALSLTRLDYLERHGELEWRQVPWAARTRTEYGRPFPYANGLAIAIHDAPSDDAPSSKAAAGTRPISKAAGGSSPLR